ncbi:peptidoglycan recognition family protein [Neosynechococcus sphagnicola]|uniref:peptidoglycan recognition protein family protein n=1 Tax=Neosynechococcus sphagnicola TaxID=1501145 RepID=UPI0006900F73|nr:peptidoglycan recognition family protein [Neosynechococcus sphagnicola]
MNLKSKLLMIALLVVSLLVVSTIWYRGTAQAQQSFASTRWIGNGAVSTMNPRDQDARTCDPSSLPPTWNAEQLGLDLPPSDGSIAWTQRSKSLEKLATSLQGYRPREVVRMADPSNYGDRYQTDIYGKPANHEYIVVLHETVYSAESAINFFRTPHANDLDQASYHTLIARDGTVIYIVPPEKRAFGAGNSVFQGARGSETVKTDPKLPPSVNNFAYHVSLETPPDGAHNGSRHSGYTELQYQSLGWLLSRTSVPESRITTHKAVDRSGTRQDPRSFNPVKFQAMLRAYPRQVRTGTGDCKPAALAKQ